jgi:hypothetical protein
VRLAIALITRDGKCLATNQEADRTGQGDISAMVLMHHIGSKVRKSWALRNGHRVCVWGEVCCVYCKGNGIRNMPLAHCGGAAGQVGIFVDRATKKEVETSRHEQTTICDNLQRTVLAHSNMNP